MVLSIVGEGGNAFPRRHKESHFGWFTIGCATASLQFAEPIRRLGIGRSSLPRKLACSQPAAGSASGLIKVRQAVGSQGNVAAGTRRPGAESSGMDVFKSDPVSNSRNLAAVDSRLSLRRWTIASGRFNWYFGS